MVASVSCPFKEKLDVLLPKLFAPDACLLYAVHQLITFFAAVDNVDTLEQEGLYSSAVLHEALRCACLRQGCTRGNWRRRRGLRRYSQVYLQAALANCAF